MKKLIFPLAIICLFAALSFTTSKAGSNNVSIANAAIIPPTDDPGVKTVSTVEAKSLELYETLGLSKLGLSKEAMIYAYKGYQYLAENNRLPNPGILTIVDFSQSSDNKRMYILDLNNNKILINTFVAHGKNTGLKTADKFSNTHESLQSSLGFYVTKGTYHGKHGLSLRLGGVEKGYNDNAESRAIVVHGATYIGAHRLGAAYQGRSFGCPAVPQEIAPKVIDIIKNGSCMFIYKPEQKYLHGSRILNG